MPHQSERIFKWLCSICESNNLSSNNLQLSIQLFKVFVTKSRSRPPDLELLGITCLFIATKFLNEAAWNTDLVRRICRGKFSTVHIYITEIVVLQALDWQISMPTSSDILRILLLITRSNTNFQKVFERSDAFVVICYLEIKLSRFSPTEIAIVSVVCALEQFNKNAYRNTWINFIIPKLNIDVSRLDECKANLVEKLILSTPINDIHKIECLTREKISTLIEIRAN